MIEQPGGRSPGQQRAPILALVGIWAAVSFVMTLFVGTPNQAICWHGIGNAINDPHAWDAYCAAVDAEWQASLTLVDRLTQWPAIWLVLFVGGLVLGAIGWVLLRNRAGTATA